MLDTPMAISSWVASTGFPLAVEREKKDVRKDEECCLRQNEALGYMRMMMV